MNKKIMCLALLGVGLFSVEGFAISDDTPQGIALGTFRIKPQARVLGAYDNRVVLNGSKAEGDFYDEGVASLSIKNSDALFDLGGRALYGYRSYGQYGGLDGNFYDVGASFASQRSAVKLGLSAYRKKTLDYDVVVDSSTGNNLGAILTATTSERSSVKAEVGYEKQLTDKTAIMPEYQGWYYNQNFSGISTNAEWQEHSASLRIGYGLTSQTLLSLSGSYIVQLGGDENGTIANVALEARSRATDKIDWNASVGISAANYDLSGSDQSAVGSLHVRWNATDKISTYIFGANRFQPGYAGSGARLVYRVGYGADWRILDSLKLEFQILHDYQKSINNGGGNAVGGLGQVRHFATAKVTYDLARNIALDLSGRYVKDEQAQDQMIVALQAVFRY